jgi:hypothetical protein
VTQGLALELGGPKFDARTRLLAGMIVLTWRTAYAEALRVLEHRGSVKKANSEFRALLELGFTAAQRLDAPSP